MKLGVIAALRNEVAPTFQALQPASRTVQGLRCHESPPYVFAVSGVGARPAATAALLLADAFKPDVILSVGFCGALTDDLQTADLILGGSSGHPATPELLELARAADPKARVAEIAMAPKVVVGIEEKRALARQTGAVAVDMESGAVAVAARDRGLGFLCVKVVIDTPSEPLASTYAGFWSVLKDLVLHPGTVMQMAYDAKRVKLAAERLRDFFVALKGKLPA
jgi:adenosylhomocysteine nucleosidase